MKAIFLLILPLIMISDISAGHIEAHKTIRPEKNIMLSVNPEIDVDPDSQTTYFHFDLGLTNRIDLNLKYGIGTKKPYYGVQFEYHFVKSGLLTFATKAGGHYRGADILDLSFIFAHKFERCSVSFGPDIQWQVTGKKQLMLEVFMTLSIPLPKSMALSFSVDIPIKNQSYSLSTGIAVYL